MKLFRKIWDKIKHPKGIWIALFYVFFTLAVTGTILLVVFVPNQSVWHYILYGVAGVSLAYFVYSIVYFAPKMKQGFIKFLRKFKFTSTLLDSYGYRTFVFSIFSFILNLGYVGLMLGMAIATGSAWYYSITAYYLALILMKGNVFYSKKKYDTEVKEARAYRFAGIMFIFLTLALSGIITLIYTSNMAFEYAGLMIYVVAAYTFYNLTLAIINIFKARNHDSLYIQAIRNVNLASSIVSLLVLQVALFQAFSPEYNKSFANGLTGGAVSAVILALGIYMIVKANKRLNQINSGDKSINIEEK